MANRSGIKINRRNRGKTRAKTKKNRNGKLSIKDLQRRKKNATGKNKQRIVFALNVRQGKIGGKK